MLQSTVKRTPVTSRVPIKGKVETHLEKPCKLNGDLNKKIAEKAYELYLKRNGGPGSAEQDWAQAEKIVKGL